MIMYDRLKFFFTLHAEKFRFLIVGGVNTAFGLGIFPLLYYIFKDYYFHYLIILSIAHFFALNFSFLTNKFFVFRTKGNYLEEYPKFLAYQIAILLAYMGPFTLLVEVGHLHPIATQLILTISVAIISYFYYSRITFLKKY